MNNSDDRANTISSLLYVCQNPYFQIIEIIKFVMMFSMLKRKRVIYKLCHDVMIILITILFNINYLI